MASEPERQCVGCGLRGPQSGFVRLALDRESVPPRVVVTTKGERKGRGAYLCRRRSCLDRALHRKALQRAFRSPVAIDEHVILTALANGAGGSRGEQDG
ncbi:MAG: YlxR family protein [Thermoleophilia bacterium]|nr:YlxR family protein [Thermoleophilia bacterium]